MVNEDIQCREEQKDGCHYQDQENSCPNYRKAFYTNAKLLHAYPFNALIVCYVINDPLLGHPCRVF